MTRSQVVLYPSFWHTTLSSSIITKSTRLSQRLDIPTQAIMDLCASCMAVQPESISSLDPMHLNRETRMTMMMNNLTEDEGGTCHIHSPSFNALEKSAALTGCKFCRFVEHNLKRWTELVVPGSKLDSSWWTGSGDEESAPVLLFLSRSRRRLNILCGSRQLEFRRVSIPSVSLHYMAILHIPLDASQSSPVVHPRHVHHLHR